MKVQISFKVLNPEYDHEYAIEYHDGKESENNCKYLWSKKYEVNKVNSVEFIEDGSYNLKGKLKDGTDFDHSIPNVSVFRCFLEGSIIIDFAVSKSVLNKTHQAKMEKYKVDRCYFYINSEPPSMFLGENLVISEDEIPKELK